ncbi:hypothetical protein BU24DRAFT_404776 [Aaosphaeria arxii CBS 175.79]|uniref:EGF-like domain-containing protein n=1 Tax=Aaosphaeria arxii CBS 175.79 TaxID=1450172 RepID=A0A6A5Y908_9PLEO|nr:uncharacterized protein BU24DRAFT_404776 [Aaosphaeria arxii CBS 175.79]KAF2021819.1 hypothetical protein BU24DRAFT_404776 [Aaosphaeria arxii CBS 175.79]
MAARPYGSPDDYEEDSRAAKGSVRAARERAMAARGQGQQEDRQRIVGLPQRPNQLVSQYSSQNQPRPQAQQNLSPEDARRGANFAPSPQWPLPNGSEDGADSIPKSSSRGPPPQRPPRPLSDELPIQPNSPSQYRTSYQSDEVFSPSSSSRPLTTSSAASEASSLGSIPDFPVPQPPMPTAQALPRRLPSLGPPPSARRGPSSYYTQMSYVSPIAEESSDSRSDLMRSHHGSFASSNVFPTNRDNFYAADDGNRSDDEETITSDHEKDYEKDWEKDFEKEDRSSRGSDHDDRSELVTPALVRQASLGRRTKPSLMTIRSVDSFGDKKVPSIKRKAVEDGGVTAVGIGGAVLAARDGLAGRRSPPESSLSNGNALLDPSSSSNESLASFQNMKLRGGTSESQRPFVFDMNDLASPTSPQEQLNKPTLADRIGRRPPKLDIDAVRDAEARGSLTSLPELIRRATRLAANLDRGKTASRLGLDFWESGAPAEKNIRGSGSLTDMLAAFPPPGEATPTGNRTPNPRRMSNFAIGNRKDVSGSSLGSGSTRRRRCCGMPMWTFVTLLIVLLFLIAAAVVIPIVLIVLPKMRDNQNAPAQSTSGNNANPGSTPPVAVPTGGARPEQCEGIISCQNGGVAIAQSDRSCNCVCINGFTGRTCSQQSDAGCTTTDIAGTANNATVGTGIPRLLESAQNNFSIPLDPPQLLSLFSSNGLTCTSENALITFNGLASRFVPILVDEALEPSRTLPRLEAPHSDNDVHKLHERQTIGEVGTPNTGNQNNPNNAATPTESASPTSTEPISSNPTALDFARIGVLFVFQESRTMDTAANAQVSLQRFLTADRAGKRNGNTVDLGPFTLDLVKYTIDFGNGTTLRALPESPS